MPIWGAKKMLLQLDDIHVSYGFIEALRGMSLHLQEGEIVSPSRTQRSRKDDDPHDDFGCNPS